MLQDTKITQNFFCISVYQQWIIGKKIKENFKKTIKIQYELHLFGSLNKDIPEAAQTLQTISNAIDYS